MDARRRRRSATPDDHAAAAEARRIEATAAEDALAGLLDSLANGALAGEYRREWPVGDWIVDFYFPDIRLAIEVDGGYHRAPSRWRADLAKARDLEARGITLLRLANAEVLGDSEHVVKRLRAAWRTALSRSRGVREEPAVYRVRRVRECRRRRRRDAALRFSRTSGSPP